MIFEPLLFVYHHGFHGARRREAIISAIMFYEAFLAGICSTIGNTLGKLSGTSTVVGDSYFLWGSLLITMVVANTWGVRFYLHSLEAAGNCVAPTVISTSFCYVLSGIIGIYFFGEVWSLRWSVGAILTVIGLTFLAKPQPTLRPAKTA